MLHTIINIQIKNVDEPDLLQSNIIRIFAFIVSNRIYFDDDDNANFYCYIF